MAKKYIDRIESIDRLVRIKATGTPKELADRLKISERSLYETLNLMKELGTPIRYSNDKRSYFYENEGAFSFQFKER